MERYALASHQRALRAIKDGAFDQEIAPYQDVSQDEGPRADTTPEKMAGLKPLREGGRITAALASQICRRRGRPAYRLGTGRRASRSSSPEPGSATCPPAATTPC